MSFHECEEPPDPSLTAQLKVLPYGGEACAHAGVEIIVADDTEVFGDT